MKTNLKIVLAIFTLMCLLGIYENLTYVPIQNPVDGGDLVIEGVKSYIWFAYTFIFNLTLFLFLTAFTYIIKLIKHIRKSYVNE